MRILTNVFFALIFFVILDLILFGGRELQAIGDRFVGADQDVAGLITTFMNDIRYAGCRQIGLIGPSCSLGPAGAFM